MKRVKLYAYFANNLGDDLMVHILLNRYPNYHFFSDSWDEDSIFLNYPNYSSMGGTQRKYGRLNHILNIATFGLQKSRFLEWIRKRKKDCVCSVYIGGSLYQQLDDQPFAGRLEWEGHKLCQSPLFIIGANFGPYRMESFRNAFGEYFQKCGGVTFRDKKSFSMFSDNPKVAYAPDVVFNLEIPGNAGNDNTVLISVIDFLRRENLRDWTEAYDTSIAELCSECIERGKKPILMSFCKKEGDEDAIKRILEKIPEATRNKTGVYFYFRSLEEVLELFRTADCVIATRFHAMILALKYGKPVFSISYNQKVKNVLQDIGLDCYCEIEELKEKCAADMLDACDTKDVSDYVKMAENQFWQFEMFMKDVN